MFHLRRFQAKRKRAALILLPAAMMITTGVATAGTGTPVPLDGASTSSSRADSDVKLDVKRHAMAGNSVKVRGKVNPQGGRWVTIRAAGKKVTTVRTKPNGSFQARWQALGAGIYRVTAVVQGTYSAERARSRAQQVNVYRAAQASYYGPGLYGNSTACGRTLTPSTLGVANKSLPCGTMVTFRYRGRTARVPVIDRGPFAGNREWDLTAATKAKLGFGSTGVVYATK